MSDTQNDVVSLIYEDDDADFPITTDNKGGDEKKESEEEEEEEDATTTVTWHRQGRPRHHRRPRRRRRRKFQAFWPPHEYFELAKTELLQMSSASFDKLCYDWDEMHSYGRETFTTMDGFTHTFGGPMSRQLFLFSVATNGSLRSIMESRRHDERRHTNRKAY